RMQADERTADTVGEDAADDRVHDGGPHEVGRDRQRAAAERDGERSREPPQDTDERDERDYGVQQAGGERERAAGERPQILGDTLVRVVGLAAGALEAIVRAAREPAVQEVMREPPAPTHLQHLRQVLSVDSRDDESRGEDAEATELPREGCGVALLE